VEVFWHATFYLRTIVGHEREAKKALNSCDHVIQDFKRDTESDRNRFFSKSSSNVPALLLQLMASDQTSRFFVIK
jgi:hypothetical protein